MQNLSNSKFPILNLNQSFLNAKWALLTVWEACKPQADYFKFETEVCHFEKLPKQLNTCFGNKINILELVLWTWNIFCTTRVLNYLLLYSAFPRGFQVGVCNALSTSFCNVPWNNLPWEVPWLKLDLILSIPGLGPIFNHYKTHFSMFSIKREWQYWSAVPFGVFRLFTALKSLWKWSPTFPGLQTSKGGERRWFYGSCGRVRVHAAPFL